MKHISDPQMNAAATMKAMAYSGFPASSMIHLYQQLKGNAAEAKCRMTAQSSARPPISLICSG
jgi:hypothetical protein